MEDSRQAHGFGDPFLSQQDEKLRKLLDRLHENGTLERYETPLLVLDPEVVRATYRRFQAAFPGVHHHYAMKALAHPAVLQVIEEEGGYFDVATTAEIQALESVIGGRVGSKAIHTHPYKKHSDIKAAYDRGIRTFVVDSIAEIDKFVAWPEAQVLIRLSYSNPYAQVDLSSKFGVSHAEARNLLSEAKLRGVRVAGFSYHPGSQLANLEPFIAAATQTRAFIEELEGKGYSFSLLDMGGGFPASYTQPQLSVEEISNAVYPILAPLQDSMTILAEPGRAIVAEAMTLITGVVGVAAGTTGEWYMLDDGLYGSYSNILTEHVHPYVVSEKQLRNPWAPLPLATLGGPTCDSSDVIARDLPMPKLQPGDLLLSPMMGAYTTVTASEFNGIPKTQIIVLPQSDPTQADQA